MPPLQAVIFDLDQTLLNRQQTLRDFCTWQAISQLQLPTDIAQYYIKKFIELDAQGHVWKDIVYQELIQCFALKFSMTALLGSYIENFHLFCIENQGVTACIKQLHASGYQLALLSNGRSPFQQRNFQALNLAQYFSAVVVSEAVAMRKPDPAIFTYTAQCLNLQTSQCVMVGDDAIADIRGAKTAMMRAVLFDPTCHQHVMQPQKVKPLANDLYAADACMQQFSQLPSILAQI
ncbi:HAD family hydrolase [Acinetobacter larvae]|uniref:Haloacid dehalogenase n=1 Tax=Acinetobacter larvae TaxID=1789224 RepID=A0A1B2M2S8_9GAMM|nr:HAD family hydrolase [Acinetobacter larvae]AOA59494.1 hypothetical protein BFG52_14815 [Acinetobacter larvae]